MKKIHKLCSVLLTMMLLWSLFGNAFAQRVTDSTYFDYASSSGVGDNVAVFTLNKSTGGTAKALCVDDDVTIKSARYYPHTLDDIPGGGLSASQQGRVKNIVLHSPLSGVEEVQGATGNALWRAVQKALWHVVEGTNYYNNDSSAEANAYRYLIGLDGNVGLPGPMPEIALSLADEPSYTLSGSDVLLSFAVNVSGGDIIEANLSNNSIGASIESYSNSAVLVRVPAANYFTTNTVGFSLSVKAYNSKTDVFALIPENGTSFSQSLITKVKLEKEKSASVAYSFKDPNEAEVVVVKTASDTDQFMPGIGFTLTHDGTGKKYNATTGADGRAVFTKLPAGSYTLSEDSGSIDPVQFSLADDVTLQFVLPFFDTAQNVENAARPASITWAKMARNYQGQTPFALQGAQFKLYLKSDTSLSNPVAAAVSGSDGVFRFENLYPGDGADYVIVETGAPDGYRENTAGYDVHLTRGQNLDLRTSDNPYVLNIPSPISIRVEKRDFYYDTPLPGAVISLYHGTPDNPGAHIADRTTGSDGAAVFGTDLNLLPGTYTVREKSAPSGYHLDASSDGAEVYVASDGAQGTAVLKNYPDLGSLTVRKLVDGVADTGVMDGVKFTLTGPSELPAYSTSRTLVLSGGTVTFTDLIPGSYTLHEDETSIPFGYTGSPDITVTVDVRAGGDQVAQDVSNASLPGHIVIQKADPEHYDGCAATDLAGAVFEIYKAGDRVHVVDTLVTNEYGYAKSKDLVMGDYVVVEVTPPSADYVLVSGDIPVTVEPGGEKPVRVENFKKRAQLTIQKTASDTFGPLKGAQFTLVGPSEYMPKTGPADKTYTATTNDLGVAEFTDLPPGTYVLTETDAPEGYIISAELSSGVSIVLAPGVSETKSFVNEPGSAGFTVKKITGEHDLSPGAVMPGVVFGIFADATSTTPVAQAATGANGEAVFENIAPGTYILKEIVQPDSRYEPAFTCNGQLYADGMEITLDRNNTSYYFTLSNEPKKVAIRAYKVEGGIATTIPLQGAKIELFRLVGGVEIPQNQYAITDSSGMAEFTGLWPGDYRLRETEAPAGYMLEGAPYIDVSLPYGGTDNFANAAADAVFENNRVLGSLIVTKTVDGDPGRTLNGVEFSLYGPTNVGHVAPSTVTKTVAGGTAVFENLYPGLYTLTELAGTANAAYNLEAPRDVEILPGTQANPTVKNVTVDNDSKPGSITLRKYEEGFDPANSAGWLQGAVFQLYELPANTAVGAPRTTDAEGFIEWLDLPVGRYKAVEISAPSGYDIVSTAGVEVTIEAGGHKHIDVANSRQLGSLLVHKVSSIDGGLSLSGAVFELYQGAYVPGSTPYRTGTTDSTGYLEFTGLYPGTYTLAETSPPSKYSMTAEASAGIEVTIQGGLQTPLTVENEPHDATAIIRKVSAADTTLRLSGATFAIYKDSVAEANLKGRGVTDANGEVKFTGLVPGYYILVEEQAPEGYVTAPNQEAVLGPGDALTFTFEDPEVPKGSLTIKKDIVGDSGTAAVFTFHIKDSTGATVRDNIQITGEGSVTIGDLKPGSYTVEELSASIPAGFVLTSSNNVGVTVTSGGTAEASFTNTSIGSLSLRKLTGAHDPNPGMPMAGVVFRLFKPGTPDALYSATTNAEGYAYFTNIPTGDYILRETDQPDSDYESVFFESGTEYRDGKPVTVTTNTTVSYTVANEPRKVSIAAYKYETNTTIPLVGARFDLYRVGSDGSETFVANAETDSSGRVEFTGLWPGNYRLRETAAAPGYLVGAQAAAGIDVTVGLGENKLTGPIFNDRQPGVLRIFKVSSHDLNLPLSGAVFHLYEGTIEPGEAPYRMMTTNSMGFAELTDIYPGTYTLIEVSAPTGYTMGADASGGVQVTFESGKAQEFLVVNTPNTATAIVLKVSADTGARLANARFALYKDSVTTAGFIARGTTDANGNIVFPNLMPGSYILVEEAAPAGYRPVANTSFTLNPGDMLTIRIADPRVPVVTPTPPPRNPTPTPRPTPTASPTPIPSEPVITIPVTEPPYGPATGEGTGLIIAAVVLLLLGAVLLIIRRRIILRR